MKPEDQGWKVWAARLAARTFLPDSRLNGRLGTILFTLGARACGSIMQVFKDSAEKKAAYRFEENPRIKPEMLDQGIALSTAKNCTGDRVLVIHDTTYMNYSKLHQTTGLGPISDKESAQGLLVHSSLATDPEGVCIGLLHQKVWARPQEKRDDSERRKLPIEEKESFKWIEGIEKAHEAISGKPGNSPAIIHLMDGEGDIFEVFHLLLSLGDSAIIRMGQDRTLAEHIEKSQEAFLDCPSLGTIERKVWDSHLRKYRKAHFELRSSSLTIEPPKEKKCRLGPLSINAVEAREISPPANTSPLLWHLWTFEPTKTISQAKAVFDLFAFRWLVEEFHLILKSGMRAEKLQYETANRLEIWIRLSSAVAARILRLNKMARAYPDESCLMEFTEMEWQLMYSYKHNRPPQPGQKEPSFSEIIRWVGQLGGHMGRKGDGMPGVRTLWRGLARLDDLLQGARLGMNLRI